MGVKNEKVLVGDHGPVSSAASPAFERAAEGLLEAVRTAPERAGRAGDQALPTEGVGDVSQELVDLCVERRAKGIRRYGTPLQLFNGRNVFRDRVEELLDAAAYTIQAQGQYEAIVQALLVLSRTVRPKVTPPTAAELRAALELAEKLEAIR